jgi:hypothetical protein
VRLTNAIICMGCIASLTGCGAPFAQSCQSLADTMKENEPEVSEVSNLKEVKRVFVSTTQGEPLIICKGDAVSRNGGSVPFEVSYSLSKSDAAGREYSTSWEFK